MRPRQKKKCDCGTVENASQEPQHPIRFDPELNEYYIALDTTGKGRMMIYYCPFCGGAVPESRRSSLFMHVPTMERWRIIRLLKGVKTISDVLARFGPPDEDAEVPSVIGHPIKDGESTGGEILWQRTLLYRNISETADVKFSVGEKESVRPSWSAKSKGKRNSD